MIAWHIYCKLNCQNLTHFYLQENPPYNKGAFRIEINFPAEYPFKPPKINFKTKIYHPNIDEKGQVFKLYHKYINALENLVITCYNNKCDVGSPKFSFALQVCLPIIGAENWKPATKTDQGIVIDLFSVML